MSRTRVWVCVGVRAALGLVAVVWWLPTIAAALLAFQAGKLAFLGLCLWIRALALLGFEDAAVRCIERAVRRLDARARRMERRG